MQTEIQKFIYSIDKLGKKLSAETIIKTHQTEDVNGIDNLLYVLNRATLYKDNNTIKLKLI